MIGDSHQIRFLAELMARQQTQQRVVSQNIANINTPGWKTLEAKFDRTLDEIVRGDYQTDSKLGAHRIDKAEGLVARNDGNNVDIDMQLGKMDKASLLFQSYSQILTGKLSMLRMAVS